MSEFTENYTNLLIQQYFCKPKAFAETELYANEWEAIFDFYNDFQNQFDIDKATGDRLDLIGKIVGISRIVEEGVPKYYFGFADIPFARTFGEGAFFDQFTDSAWTSTQLSDSQYRFFIKAKVAKNTTSAYMAGDENSPSDNGRVTLQETIQTLFDGQAFILDNYDMSLTLYIDDTFPEEDIFVINALDLIPRPQAVGLDAYIYYSTEGTFGFAGNPEAKTFGEGKFAKLIIFP